MIESLLKNVFPVHFGLPRDSVKVSIRRYVAPFTLSDPKACDQCLANSRRTERLDCNREVLKVNTNGVEVAVVEFEKYIGQFENTNANISDRCDILMSDGGMTHRKVVFCDMCCQEEKYVEPNDGSYPMGKRAKARQQMERSINVLLEESTTAVNLLTYTEKVCLFAWRDYGVPDKPVKATRANARSNVRAFSSVISNMAGHKSSIYEKLEHSFEFIQVKYPSVYNW